MAIPQFMNVLDAAFRRKKSAEPGLTWAGIAREVEIDKGYLWRVVNEGKWLNARDLLKLLIRLGCSEEEQIFIFKLQGSTHPIEQDTAEQWAVTWVKSPPPQTEPVPCSMQEARRLQEKAAENA